MADLVHNERTKLMATFLSNVGVATVAGGAFVPLFSSAAIAESYPFSIAIVGILMGVSFMSLGVYRLKDLKE